MKMYDVNRNKSEDEYEGSSSHWTTNHMNDLYKNTESAERIAESQRRRED